MDIYRKVIIILFIILGLILILGFAVGLYFYNLALNPHYDKSSVLEAPHNQIETKEEALSEGAGTASKEEWLDSGNGEDIYTESFDGLKLHAYRIRQPGRKWAILAHGYTGNGRQMTGAGMNFFEMGFSLMMPDARGHGKSEGSYIGMGWHERRDMLTWIDEILKEDKQAEIILYGVSMGAATVMMTAGEILPENVRAIIEDCGYTSVDDEFSYQLKATFRLQAFPIIQFASAVTYLKAGYTLKEADARTQIAKSSVPILFIHGDEDTFVPSYMVHQLYDLAPGEKDILIIPGAGHGTASQTDPETYWQTIRTFLSKYI